MATVLTTFTTANNQIIPSEFRSMNPKRCKLSTINLPIELQELYGVDQLEIEFPFGPRDMQFNSQAAMMDSIQRPGKKPLLEKRNEPLRTVTFNVVIASTAGASGGKLPLASGTTPVDTALETIERMAMSGAACKLLYGTVQLGYNVSITKFDFTVKHRDSEGHPVRVDAQIQLTEKPAFVQELTNLPIIPNDPPPSDPPGAQLTPKEEWYQVLTQWESGKLTDYMVLVEAAKAAGEDINDYVYLQLGIAEIFNDVDFGSWPGIEIGTEPFFDPHLDQYSS